MPEFTRRALWAGAALAAFSGACSRSPGPEPQPATSATTTGGAQPTLTSDDIDRAPGDPIELLMSRSPGVWVGRSASGAVAVRIRGTTSIRGNNEPLYLLDGVPFQPGSDGSLIGVNPYDIASIKVLKDPAELSLYGVRGANGVILIKTKRPQR